MNRIKNIQKGKTEGRERDSIRNELIRFAAEQFKTISKKNLKVPFQLFHL